MFFATGCGFFSEDGDPFDVEFTEDIPISFSIDGDDLCPPTADCTGGGTAPAPITPPEVESPPIEIDVQQATGSNQLADVSGRLKRVEIESVDYEYADNTLNTQGPRVVIFVGPVDANSRGDSGVVQVVDLPPALPDDPSTWSGTATVPEDKKAVASELFKSLRLSAIPVIRPAEIPRGSEYPTGSTDVKLTLNLKFVANPTEL